MGWKERVSVGFNEGFERVRRGDGEIEEESEKEERGGRVKTLICQAFDEFSTVSLHVLKSSKDSPDHYRFQQRSNRQSLKLQNFVRFDNPY